MSTDPAPTVNVVDDDPYFRESITRLLGVAGLHAVGFGSVEEFLRQASEDSPGCMLLDIAMPGLSGIDLLNTMSRRELSPPIIFVTGRDDIDTTVNVMKRGAFDYIVKPVGAERLLPVVEKALRFDAERRLAHNKLEELRQRFDRLSAAQQLIFWGVANYRLNKQLAADLDVCERTIKLQRAQMMATLSLRNVPELAAAAALLRKGVAKGVLRPGFDADSAERRPEFHAAPSMHPSRPAPSVASSAAQTDSSTPA